MKAKTIKILLIASSYRHAEHWMYEHRLDKSECKFISEAHDFRGFDLNKVIVAWLPGWWQGRSKQESDRIEGMYEALKKEKAPA